MNKKSYLSILWFVLGFGIFAFTRMSKLVPTIPIAILFAPIFILRFNRSQPVHRGNLLILLGFTLSIFLGLWGLFDLNAGLYNAIRNILLAVLYSLPYMIDRWIYARLKDNGISSAITTLIFPTITTAVFFLSSLEGPFDGAVQAAKFVFGPIVTQQILSILGIWVFIFISSWFASTINYMWENNFDLSKSKIIAFTITVIVIAIFSFGAIKTAAGNSEPDTVKIAAIILIPENPVSLEQLWAEKQVSPFEETVAKIENLTQTAALEGAKIVSFQEFAMLISEEDEGRLRGEYQRTAKENDVYLSITYAYYAKEGKGENKHLLIDNHGEILLDYSKRYVSGLAELNLGEAGIYKKGPEILQSVDTPYGKIAISICRDMEFPQYMRQAGRADVDIMLSPAYEWPKGLVVHSVYMRSIEYGFSLVRPTQEGISVGVDYYGNILNQMDSADPGDGIMYADVPTWGVDTLYTKIGDLLGWVCVLGLLGLISFNIFLTKNQRKELVKRPNPR